MSKRFKSRNRDFLYFNGNGVPIPRRPAIKINVVNAKRLTNSGTPKDTVDSSKAIGKIPTPREVLNDYLESTTVHGLQYFSRTEIKVGTLGKILWTCTIFTSFVCLSLMVMQFLRRYNENPTNTYIKTFNTPIHQAPFPAVTVCPLTPIPLKRRLDILENAILPENMSRIFALNILKYAHHITNPFALTSYNHSVEMKSLLDANGWGVSEFLKILIPCEDIFESCWWSTERIDCSKSIKVSRSSYGLCCSFNYRLENYVGLEKGQMTAKLKPLSSADFGRASGLKLVVNHELLEDTDPDVLDPFKLTDANDMMVLIHHSMDFPGLNTDTYMLQANHDLEIAVNPELFQKPKGVQHRNKEDQLVPVCVADDENTLDYFPVYRYSNCYANCRIRMMIQICGCLPFIYDYISKHYNVDQCGIEQLLCIQSNIKQISIVKDIKSENFTCSCGTPCESVNYEGYPNAINFMEHSSNKSRKGAVVRVFMASQTFVSLVTLPAADETYLLASIGGIFSLFLGCSFLSVVEIVYFAYLFCRAILLRKAEAPTKQTSKENLVNARRHVVY